MRVAILGGGSCFAMNLASHLVKRGDDVLSISRSQMRGKPFTYGLEDKENFRYVQAHLVTQLPLIMSEIDDFMPQRIINFAALCEVGQSWLHALDYYQTNVMALVRLTNELATRSWPFKFVQIGSSEVYGSVYHPARETDPLNPSTPYAASKAAFDAHLRAIARHENFQAVIVMPSNGYCEGQTLNRIIPKAIICAKTGAKLKLQGGGVARKSYLHADDISSAIMLVAETGTIGGTYNCGPDDSIQIRDLVGEIAAMLGKKLEDIAEISPERVGQDSQYWLDSSKIRTYWEPKVDLRSGLNRMIDWVDRYPELLTADSSYRHRP